MAGVRLTKLLTNFERKAKPKKEQTKLNYVGKSTPFTILALIQTDSNKHYHTCLIRRKEIYQS